MLGASLRAPGLTCLAEASPLQPPEPCQASMLAASHAAGAAGMPRSLQVECGQPLVAVQSETTGPKRSRGPGCPLTAVVRKAKASRGSSS